jgi:hypothetical protein
MKNISGDATIKHTSSDNTPVVVGDNCYQTKNSDNTTRFEIRYNGDAGYISKPTFFAIALDKLRTCLGIVAGVIKNGTSIAGITGTYGADSTATADQIVKDKTAYGKNGKITGTMNLTAGVLKNGTTLGGVTGTYGGDATADASHVLKNKTAYGPSGKITGTMDLTAGVLKNGTVLGGITGTYGGDATAAAEYILNGKTAYGATGKMTGSMPLTAGKIKKGETLAGITGTWYGNKAYIGVSAYDARNDSDSYHEESFTMPANGMVYYGGSSGGWYYPDADTNSTCAIYKNGVLVKERNIVRGDYTFRGGMFNQKFSASAGDVIKVVASCSRGYRGDFIMSCIQAVIVY